MMAFEKSNCLKNGTDPESEMTKIKQESFSDSDKTIHLAHSIDHLVNSSSTPPDQVQVQKNANQEWTPKSEPSCNSNSWIKFSVENILKPDFGKTRCDIARRVIPPVFQSNDKTRTSVRRSFDDHKFPEEAPKRRHSAGAADPQPSAEDGKTRFSNGADGSDGDFSAPKELWPAWVYCTRYSDRPSSGPRSRRMKRKEKNPEDKRPRTAFSREQLSRLKHEFNENRYLTERRRRDLAKELDLNEAQIKIWFQNKRAKLKKAKGEKNPLALQLMAQGLYNHSTVAAEEEEQLEEMARKIQARVS